MKSLGNPTEWVEFLKKHSEAAETSEWPGNPGATEEQISAVEAKLKVTLPPSYRAFLKASNGWRNASQFVPILRPVQDIKWFRKEHKDWVDAYVQPMAGADLPPVAEQDYFNYGSEDAADFESRHLSHALCISEEGDSAVVLLNPMVVWPDGEWETWFFANWVPGAVRYRSFADWMLHEHGESFKHTNRAGELPTVFLDAPGKIDRRIRRQEKIPDLKTLLAKLKSPKVNERVKAARKLSRLKAAAVEPLLGALKSDPAPEVRAEAAESLGKLRAPQAVDALIAAIDDEGVNTTAIHALGNIEDERAAQCLLRIVENAEFGACSAAYQFVKRRDHRAIPHLVRFLVTKDPRDFHIGNSAGSIIAEFQNDAAYDALEPLASHPDREIRAQAANGLSIIAFCASDKALRIKSRERLKRCLETETDATLRGYLETHIEITAKKAAK